MKKTLTILAIAAVAISATADITGFIWKENAAVTDKDGVAFAEGPVGNIFNFYTVNGSELLALVTPDSDGNGYDEIDITALTSLISIGSSTLTWTGKSGYTQNSQTDGGIATIENNVIGLFSPDFASLASAAEGDFIGFTMVDGPLVDLQPDTGLPAASAQLMLGGDIQSNIEVIPEPATLGLMGVAGLGMFLARRKSRR